MLGAIYTAMSGMNAFSQGLQTISNNVANLNTTGFKEANVEFQDLYNQGGTGGGLTYTPPNQTEAGFGVRTADPSTDFAQGTLQQTGNALDLAIQGSGFLTLLDGSQAYYTRTGSFAVDQKGFITLNGTAYHLAVLNSSNLPEAVNVDASSSDAPAATTSITFANNLSSGATSADVPSITVFDSTGGQHTWDVSLAPASSGPAGSWTVTAKDETGATIGTGTLTFTNGVVNPTTAKITVNATPTGAAAMAVVLDFSNVTSFSAGTSSTLSAPTVDGHASGDLSTVTVNASGQVILTYSNSQTKNLGSVAMADFRDPQSLTQVSNDLFKYPGTGQYRYLTSGQDGIGILQSQQLESSNVNLTSEFGDLILIQRGYQASSEVVSVSNDMIQQLFGIRGQA